MTLVSVIIPTFNRSNTLCRSINSVLSQTHQDIEVIVVDDGSTDNTAIILESYGKQIRWVCQAQVGPSAARNVGVDMAKGEFVAFLDSDDEWLPQKIEFQLPLLIEAGSGVPCCICNAKIFEGDERCFTAFAIADVVSSIDRGYWTNPEEIIGTRFVLFNQVVLIKKSAFFAVGGFSEDLRILEDHDLAFRLAQLGPWAFVQQSLVLKYNDTKGIGVSTMQDRPRHAEAWYSVLMRCRSSILHENKKLLKLIEAGLHESRIEILCHRRLVSNKGLGKPVVSIIIWLLAKWQGLRRLSWDWPKVNVVARIV